VSETLTVLVKEVKKKSGEKNGKPWTVRMLIDGNDELVGSAFGDLLAGVEADRKYDVEREKDGKYWNVVSIKPHEDEGPRPFDAKTANDEPDWDKKGLHMTRCALWRGFFSGDGIPALMAWWTRENSDKGEAELLNFLRRVGVHLVTAAEFDTYNREPATEDDLLPFG
jgi:hypothetical protein